MSMPTIPDFNPDINISREDAVNIVIASIAMEELALAHILNAEGEKLQYILGTLGSRDPGEVTICDVMAVNTSIQKTLRDVISTEMLLQFKMEDAVELAEREDECRLTIRGRKIWRDGNNLTGKRPSYVEIILYRDEQVYKSVTIYSTDDGRYSFPCLPVWKNSTQKYSYRVDEKDVPAGYTKKVDGYDIINTIEPGSITVEGTKTWDDNHNEDGNRPLKITVHLMNNGEKIRTIQVDSPPEGEDSVKFSFAGVPQFDENGSLIVYTLDEDEVDGYKKNISGLNITNSIEIPYPTYIKN